MMKRIYMLLWLAGCLALSLSAQQTKELYLLHTSDMHSRVEPLAADAADADAGKGGLARRAAFVRQFCAEHPNTLVLDCGDISQGTPYYNFYKGEVEILLMNHMGYDAMAIGNHEFDFGMENMARLFRMARFPVVCSNYEVAGTPLEGLVKPYVVIERGGLRMVYKDPIPVAQAMADLLRNEEHCDAVICLSHLGIRGIDPEAASDEKLVAATSGIDAILGGHSHTFMETPAFYPNAEGRETPVFHTGRNGVYVGVWTLTLTKK